MNPPSGNVTFLFTDIEGSTKLSQDYPDTLQTALEKHHSILQKAIEENNGFVFEIVGDAFCCAFEDAAEAVKAAVEIQKNLSIEKWKDVVIKIRTGIHSGVAEWNGKRYIGYITLARTARVMSSAYGEQILISNSTYELIKEKFDSVNDRHITFRDLGERRLKDVIQPIRLYQIVSPGLREDFPPLKTLDARPNNLPVQLTSFIGREEEMEDVKYLLKHSRLLTLTGSGGAGKTRLALQVAADVIDDFTNGVWLAELASVFEPSLLYQTFLKVFGLNEEQSKTPENILCDFLRDKEILIIFDNCEQIVSPCAMLAEKLISKCPKLKIISTSREALNCYGENTHKVLSLKIPDPKEEFSTEQISQYEAVRLFIDRANAVDKNFKVNNENAPALAQICYQLDGIPLAIELAAARVKNLSVDKIYERLDDRFRLLTIGKRTALPRQQTLRAMVDWSYELLSEKEKLLWSRLSVFSDGWTIEAAEEVCSDENLLREEIIDLLSQLADKSLIITVNENKRYRMLETIRQYGDEKLFSSGKTEEIILKHLDYYTGFAVYARKNLEGPLQKQWIDKIEAETFNFQLALTSSIVRNRREKGILIANNLSRYWEIRGYINEAVNWLEELLSTNELLPALDKALAIQWLGSFNWITGNLEKSQICYEESFAIFKQIESKTGIATSLNNLGLVANASGEFNKSKVLTEESYKYFLEIGNEQMIADCLINLGAVLINLKETDYAKYAFEESLKFYRKFGDIRGVAMSLSNLGSLEILKNDYVSARIYLEEGLSIQREISDKRGTASTLNSLGKILFYQNYFSKAEKYFEESIKFNLEIGDKKSAAGTMSSLGFLKYRKSEYNHSKRLHIESLKINQDINYKSGIANALIGIAEVLSRNEPELAAQILGAADTYFQTDSDSIDTEIKNIFDKIISDLKEKLYEEFRIYFEKGKKITLEDGFRLIVIS